MNVPYTVCHILSALDGRISGAFIGLDSVHDAAASYARIRFDYQADAWVYGSTTTREFVSAAAPYPRSLSSDVPSDFAAEKDAGLYYVSVDPKGEIGWSSPTFIRPGCPEAHVIEVLLEDAPDAYREYLRGITVTGGNITAVSGSDGAGIGGGDCSDGTDIIIKGDATVIASGDTGAGIGGGGDGSYIGGYGKVTITDQANVKAWSQWGAGIGGGRNAGGDITISKDATVAAEAFNGGVAIGSGGYLYPSNNSDNYK